MRGSCLLYSIMFMGAMSLIATCSGEGGGRTSSKLPAGTADATKLPGASDLAGESYRLDPITEGARGSFQFGLLAEILVGEVGSRLTFTADLDTDMVIFCEDEPLDDCVVGKGHFYITEKTEDRADYRIFVSQQDFQLIDKKKIAVVGVDKDGIMRAVTRGVITREEY